MRLLVTGSRDFHDEFLMRHELEAVKLYSEQVGVKVTLVHGAARGADTLAEKIAADFGWDIESHPADWDKFGKRAGYVRNQEMLDSGIDMCLAFPLGESKGTRMMIKLVEKADLPLKVVEAP